MTLTHYEFWRGQQLPFVDLWSLSFDGSCPGNPGPMGIGYTLGKAPYAPIVRVGQQIGQGTNNIAEYQALLAGLRHALRIGMWKLNVVSDSLLVVKQLVGAWAVRDGTLARLHREAGMLMDCFAARPNVRHTFREDNAEADALSRTLENVSPGLPSPRAGRALLNWQAAAVNVWWHSRGVRSAAILAKIFGVQDVQIDQIVQGKSYLDATFDGVPTYAEIRTAEPRLPHVGLRAPCR